MLSREEIEQMINQKIEQKIEPLTEEIAALKAQLSKVDLLAIDTRNIRQSLGRIETTQERLETAQKSLKLDFERQEKRIVHFERQTNEQFTSINSQIADIKADTTALKEQSALTIAMLRRILPPEEQR
jgi:predicted  nucleic acid-binding Zn-ribbon protein